MFLFFRWPSRHSKKGLLSLTTFFSEVNTTLIYNKPHTAAATLLHENR